MNYLKGLWLAVALCASTPAWAQTIGVSMAYFDQNFLTIIRQVIDKEAKARGITVQFEDARGDVGRQTDQVQSFISAGVDAIIVDPVNSASTPVMTKMVQAAGVPLVYVNRTPGDAKLPRAWCSSAPTSGNPARCRWKSWRGWPAIRATWR